MDRRSIAQEYVLLATTENGTIPAMRRSESHAGIVAAGVMDLLVNGVIAMEKKKITVTDDLPGELGYLAPLYTYLKEKPRSTERLMGDYLFSTSSRIKQLTAMLGESLLEAGAVTRGEGGLFGKKTIYIPETAKKEALVEAIKSAVAEGVDMSPHDMALLCILQETKNLNQYFSREENNAWKAIWREIKKNPQNKQLADMIHYVSDMTAAIATLLMMNGSI